MKPAKPEFLESAQVLSNVDKERTLSRMKPKLLNRFFRGILKEEEAIAIQLAREERALNEWRERIKEMRAKDKNQK